MHLHPCGSFFPVVLIAAGMAIAGPSAARAALPLGPLMEPGHGALLLKTADSGIDIVRMPPRPPSGGQTASSTPGGQPPKGPPPAETVKSQGRLLKLPVKVGSQPSDSQKGWLGVRMDPLELALAKSLGLDNSNGALVLDTISGSPLSQSGIRFGDVIVALNGKEIAGVSDFLGRVASITPGGAATLDVWRASAEEADFLQTLRRLGYGGNAQVMYLLGKVYATGSGVVRDDAEALQWYRKGASAGNVYAMTALGAMVLDGRGTVKDAQEAVYWLKAAVDKNHVEAMYRLARVLVDGKTVSKDAPEAMRLFTKAAEAGYGPAMADLGIMYSRGDGIEADFAKAAMWYKRAVDLGNSAAMVNLGLLHQQGKGVAQDSAAAVALYRRSVSLGHPAGMHNLAWMLDSGQGVERKNPEEAADLIMRALDRRNEFTHRQMTTTQNSRAWSKEFRQALQRKLREAGFYPGTADGEFGEPTIAAINGYFNRSR
jgi:TPR repeat protein